MRIRAKFATVVVAFAAGSSACGGGGAEVSSGSLVASDQKIADEIKDYVFGDLADLGGGISIRVSAPAVAGDGESRWLEVTTRAEYRGKSDEVLHPQLGIVCNGSADDGSYLADSTVNFFDELPPDSFTDGKVLLLVPGDDRIDGAVPKCETPAFVRVSQSGFLTEDAVEADFPLSEELVAELNSMAESTP